MDELVERVAMQICRAGGYGLCVGFCHSKRCMTAIEQFEATARAIIPIVQADQRERDAGIAEELVAAYQSEQSKLSKPSLVFDSSISAGKAIATAIRGAE